MPVIAMLEEGPVPTLHMTSPRPTILLLASLCCALSTACNHATTQQPTPEQQAKAEQKQQAQTLVKKENADRDEIDQIPPPSKVRYLSVHSSDGWANPFLTVHRDTVELRIIFPQTTGAPVDGGSSLLHPAAARTQTMDVRLTDLPDALAAIPSYAWPYGRVIALEESEAAKRTDRAQVRRTEEATIQVLNDLGIVVDEWSNNPNSLLH
jgi:hypothetical protein